MVAKARKSEYVTVRLDSNAKRQLEAIAQREERTLSSVCARIIRESLRSNGEK